VLEADPGEHELTLQVVAPNGEALLQRPPQMRLNVPPNAVTANIVAELKGLQLKELGRHRIELRAGDRTLGSTPFTVSLIWQGQQAAKA
jgi:hypothetical protein